MISFSNICSDDSNFVQFQRDLRKQQKTQVECHEACNKDLLASMLPGRDKGKG